MSIFQSIDTIPNYISRSFLKLKGIIGKYEEIQYKSSLVYYHEPEAGRPLVKVEVEFS